MNRFFKSIRLILRAGLERFRCCCGLAQQPPRQFAPGVLTTIPPAPQAEEMFSGPRPLVEMPIAIKDSQYEPKLASKSSTVYERSQSAMLRRTIWNLEFSFKPMRMIYVDVPQASGRMQRQLVWYMVYRVRNLGNHLKPKGLVDARMLCGGRRAEDPNEEVLELVDPSVPEPRSCTRSSRTTPMKWRSLAA